MNVCTHLECQHHNHDSLPRARLGEPPAAAATGAAAVVTAARGVDGVRCICSTFGGHHREIGGGKSQIDDLNKDRAAESA